MDNKRYVPNAQINIALQGWNPGLITRTIDGDAQGDGEKGWWCYDSSNAEVEAWA